MSLMAVMNSQEIFDTAQWAEVENRRLSQEFDQRKIDPNQSLGKDDFLRILMTQLSNQDPTAPMQDNEFIAQMAQFSALEQMTNMASDFSRMARMLQSSEAATSLGQAVEISAGDEMIRGIVEAVTRDEAPQVLVNGRLFGWEQVTKIINTAKENDTL
ncbi:MAG: flagellar hook assembly protein FlgD [Treponema sp.]|nr:flagellar hook assembly protein FlgD [Treponema sp.]